MKIRRLPPQVANQIAAGEVVERPASVVKELIENAYDAGASRIQIEIICGGLNLIKVSDNGEGIVAEELLLAVAPQATSKIYQFDDLNQLSTMGFRGEALASIASIAKLEIISRTAQDAHASSLQVQGGVMAQIEPAARQIGTTIVVRDLFFNTPVRKKFLHSEKREFQLIESMVKRFALTAIQVEIELSHNGMLCFKSPAVHCQSSYLERVRLLLGKKLVESLSYCEVSHQQITLKGWITHREYQRNQNDLLWIYVNHRIVKDKILSHAVRMAYEDRIAPGKYPGCLLYLSLPPDKVDVNVHPMKYEVRFEEPRDIHDLISVTLKNKINENKKNPSHKDEIKSYSKKMVYQGQEIATHPYSSAWTILNEHFAIVFLENTPYLIDAASMQRYWLLSLLRTTPLPLLSRMLLVPISYQCKGSFIVVLEALIAQLNQFGLLVNQVADDRLMIRSIPLLVPHLRLEFFLNKFFAKQLWSTEELLELMCDCQNFNLYYSTEEEKQVLYEQLSLLSGRGFSKKLFKSLSTQCCGDILSD